ncbi:MAG: hypothetical protein JO053_14450 [Acidobacteria bacterium]|nr:hypothetical protein [Acidobacteriota bacterium]
MSSFKCEHCGVSIIEGHSGRYITQCKHYPLEGRHKSRVTFMHIEAEGTNEQIREVVDTIFGGSEEAK